MESELISKAQNGDLDAMRILYDRTFDSLYRYVRFKVSTDEDAEDLVSEAFVRAFESIKKFRSKSSFKTYVYTIAHNLLVDYYKHKSMHAVLDSDQVEIDEEHETVSKTQKLIEKVKSLFAKLSATEQRVIELRFLSNMSVHESSIALELSESNTKVITHRAIKKMKDLINNE